MITKIKKLTEHLLWYLATENCRHCQTKYAAANFFLCHTCQKQIAFFKVDNTCPTCGGKLQNKQCNFCDSREVFFSGADFLFWYTGSARTILREAKFHNSKRALHYIESQLRLPSFLKKTSYLLPLPSAKPLTQFTAQILQKHSLATLLNGFFILVKEKDIKQLAKQERLSQMQKLQLLPLTSPPSSLDNIILIDDIFTSGATLNRAARLVHEVWQVPKEKIFSYALFRREISTF